MKKCDEARLMIKKVSNSKKVIWHTKYKKLRNQVNNQIKKESLDFNNNRIDNAGNENFHPTHFTPNNSEQACKIPKWY